VAGRVPGRLVGLGVELVLDLADDLLEHVLQGDDPDRRVVLVDHQGQVLAVAAQRLQQLVERDAVGDPAQRPGQVAEAGLAVPAGGTQQVLGVDDPQGGVEAAVGLAQREPGVAAVGPVDLVDGLGEALVEVSSSTSGAGTIASRARRSPKVNTFSVNSCSAGAIMPSWRLCRTS